MMKILNSLTSIVLESSMAGEQPYIYKVVFSSHNYEDIHPIMKVFNNNLHELFKFFDRVVPNVGGPSDGELFLGHIQYNWEQERALEYIINALGGMRNWDNGMVDNDLMDEYVIEPYLNDMRYISKNENGRIILELMPGEEAEFFDGGYGGNSVDCNEVAKQIFGDGYLEWEPYQSDMNIEDLLELLSEENYIKLVRYIGTEFQNEEVDAWREEFDGWREEDQLPEGKVFLTLNRMNGFLGDDRYNLAVLIGNTPELDDVENEIKNAYGRAWNEVVQNQYYTSYYTAFEEFLGKPMGDGTTFVYKNVVNQETGKDEYKGVRVPVKYFDVTDRARAMIVRHAYEIDSPDDFLGMVQEFDMNTLCPAVDDYPWDDDEVNDLFQDYVWDYL
ncbi:hypothetical protein N9322_01590 [bacterium]|nr:hypothetical protein [bacterium]